MTHGSYLRNFPGGLMIKALPSSPGGAGVIPAQETGIPHATGCGQKLQSVNK